MAFSALRALVFTCCLGVCCLGAVLLAAPVRAQDSRAEARARFERGVELYDEGRFDAALAEFTRAYELAPAPAVLFNIAQVHAALGHAVEAVDAFERYLAEGGAQISASRRAESQAELARQRPRIARVVVESNVLGAIVSIDDVDVGTTPLADRVRVSAGEHVIAVRAPGHETVSRRLRIAGGEEESIHVELIESASPRATLRLRATVPGVEVLLDDRSLGLTPFDTSVQIEAGPHRVIGRRAGYRTFEQNVVAPLGSEVAVDVAMERDPAAPSSALGELALVLPDAEWSATIDGESVPRGERALELPAGPHDLALEVAQRRPLRTQVDVPAATTTELRPELAWTPEARQAGHAAIDAQHIGGVLLVAGGVVFVGGGIATLVLNRDSWADADEEAAKLEDACGGTLSGSSGCEALYRNLGFLTIDDYLDDLNGRRRTLAWIDAGGAIAIGIGGAAMIAGTVLLIATPSHGEFEERASARLELGPGSLRVRGTF